MSRPIHTDLVAGERIEPGRLEQMRRAARETAAPEAGALISHQGGTIELGLDQWHALLDELDDLRRRQPRPHGR